MAKLGNSFQDGGLRSLADLVAAAAQHRPAATAIVDGEVTLSWREVAEQCGRLASTLAAEGVAPGDRVGVHFRKSADAFVAMHAVVQIGAVAVPLDPSASADYVVAVANDTGCRALVTHDPCRASAVVLADQTPIKLVVGLSAGVTDEARPVASSNRFVTPNDVAAAPAATPVEVDPDSLAYIISTSGSTGRPKGLCHTHRSALAHVRAVVQAYGMAESDRISDIAPHHFDISTMALWATPAVGATNVVVREQHQMLPASLATLAAASKITIWYSVPYLLTQLLSRGALQRHDLTSLRWVIFGGELFTPALLSELMAALPAARFSNIYGPAEVNGIAAYHLPKPPDSDDIVPVGRPLVGCHVRLTDPETNAPDHPVSAGESGEIWVKSDTMMRGYWNRPDLDEAAFAVDDIGDRWYRTGDLAYYNPDGELVFTGRRDHQVKVRGFRVELGAVEAALEAIPGITYGVATVLRREDGNDTIITGYVTDDGTEHDATDLTRQLSSALPTYSLPSRFTLLAHPLPMTGSGKLDRRSLRMALEDAALQLTETKQGTSA